MERVGLILFGAIIGTLLSYVSSYGLWFVQANYEHKKGVEKSREELIVEAAELFSFAPKIDRDVKKAFIQTAEGQTTLQNMCLAEKLRGEVINSCDKNINDSIIDKLESDVFVYSARFEKLKILSFLYFCDKTKSKFENLGKSKAWWEITPNETTEVLKAMHVEYKCKF